APAARARPLRALRPEPQRARARARLTRPARTRAHRRRRRARLAAGRAPFRASLASVTAAHRRRQMRQHVERGVDEREVRERLREIAEQPLRSGVVLLREETDVVREANEPPEELVRLVVAAEQLVAVDEPERARQ